MVRGPDEDKWGRTKGREEGCEATVGANGCPIGTDGWLCSAFSASMSLCHVDRQRASIAEEEAERWPG